MDRDYNNGRKDDVVFFTGREIEKTPAYDKETLFVVGIQPVEDILKIVNRTNKPCHIIEIQYGEETTEDDIERLEYYNGE